MNARPFGEPEDFAELRALWEQSPDPRIAAYARLVPERRMADFLFGRAAAALREPGAEVHAIRSGNRLRACGSRRILAWDSKHLGCRAARLDMLVAGGTYRERTQHELRVLADVFRGCRIDGVSHLTIRVDAGDLAAVHALECGGFELIDGIQTMALELRETEAPAPRAGFMVRPFAERDLAEVLAIARASYVYDRFHADPAIPRAAADAVNEAWLLNACAGVEADHVAIAADDRGVVGYVTCKRDVASAAELGVMFGTIVMVATAERARGQGVAERTTQAVLHRLAAEGVRVVEVGTQLRNVPAARLYQKCGFRQVAAALTFRKLLDE